jgi:hypothetical protein
VIGSDRQWVGWRKSSYSETGNCVEVARGPYGVVVRDSKAPVGPRLRFGADAWSAFIDAVRDDGFPAREAKSAESTSPLSG